MYSNKYLVNKYPRRERELVTLIQTTGAENKGVFTGLVLPDVRVDITGGTSLSKISSAIKHAYGNVLVKVCDTSSFSMEGLAKATRNDFKNTFYVNSYAITILRDYFILVSTDIIEATKEYIQLATKGNASVKGLNATDEARFNELDRKIGNYYMQGM
jgi:hypothetical protein